MYSLLLVYVKLGGDIFSERIFYFKQYWSQKISPARLVQKSLNTTIIAIFCFGPCDQALACGRIVHADSRSSIHSSSFLLKTYMITCEFPRFQATDWSEIIKLVFLGAEKKIQVLVSSQSKSPRSCSVKNFCRLGNSQIGKLDRSP